MQRRPHRSVDTNAPEHSCAAFSSSCFCCRMPSSADTSADHALDASSTEESPSPEESPFSGFTRRTWIVVATVVSVVLLLILLWQLMQVLLVVFAGLLFAIFLRGVARPLRSRFHLRDGISVTLVLVGIFGLFGGLWALIAPSVGPQIDEMAARLPGATERAIETIQAQPWGPWIIEQTPSPEQLVDRAADLSANFFGAFSTAIGGIAYTVFALVLGVYLAINPRLYQQGIVLMVPKGRRDRAEEIVRAITFNLWQWLLGQFMMMVMVGVLTGLGLAIAGVPLAGGLALIAGLFEFVPIVGPLAAAVPGLLIAFTIGPLMALYALVVYVVVQQLESNVMVPVIMKKMVSLPPALTLSATVIFGVLFGLPGVILATPLALVGVILVRMIYVNDVLGDNVPPVPANKPGKMAELLPESAREHLKDRMQGRAPSTAASEAASNDASANIPAEAPAEGDGAPSTPPSDAPADGAADTPDVSRSSHA